MEASDCVHGGYHKAAVGGDHFIVEELLDFSNEETDEGNAVNGGDDGGFEAEAATSTESSTVTAVDSCNSSFSGVADASFSGELCEPLQYDELAELEWLSNFVEESFSSEDLHLISGPEPDSGPNSSSSTTRNSEVPSSAGNLTASVPGKARSKRSRPAPRNWTSRLLVLDPKPAKRREIKIAPMTAAAAADSNGRKCLHCATDKTPQWRTGPMGPKTLCNACGVRYKSGRLVPEYRPAMSPTFVMSKHSNSHRKVMEMRKKKEMQQQFVGPAPPAGEEAEEVLIHEHLGPDFRQLI